MGVRVFSLCVGVLLLLLLLCCAGEAQGRLRDVWDAVRQEAHEVMEQVRMVDMHQAEKMIRDMLGEVMGEEAAGTLRAGAARVDGWWWFSVVVLLTVVVVVVGGVVDRVRSIGTYSRCGCFILRVAAFGAVLCFGGC